MILVSHISGIRPERDYPESSATCPNEMHYGTKSIVGNVPASVQKMRNESISRLHADMDVCKGSTDMPRKATQRCSATLNSVKRFRNPLLWQQMRTETESSAIGTPSLSVVGGCQIIAGVIVVALIIAGFVLTRKPPQIQANNPASP